MLEFELPWVFALLPLPLLIYWLLPAAQQQQAAVRVPFFSELQSMQVSQQRSVTNAAIKRISLALGWLCLVSAAAAPTWIGDTISLPTTGREMMLAVDLSGSMEIADMRIQGESAPRIIAVKAVLNEFIERRKGDRLGLILFGSQAYVQAPLTFDRTTVKRFLTESQIGFAGKETAIGDAIGLAVKRLRNRPGERHVVILLTDGANTAGQVNPLAAAKLAAENSMVIYTVGVGADEMVTPGLFGSSFGSRRVNPSADLDETTLQAIADTTGGRYFRARNPEELMSIYQLLDELEPIEDEEKTFRPRKALFYWPLAAALAMTLLLAVIQLPWRLWATSLSPRSPQERGND